MRSCEKFRALIPKYAAGELDDKSAAKLQRHIAKCPDCSALLDAQKSGKLYIIGTADESTPKKSGKRRIIVFTSIAAFFVILAAAAVCLRLAGFVRIASVTVDELSLDYVQSELPDMLITETDLSIAANAAEAANEFFLENPDAHFSQFRFSMESDEVKDIGFAGGSIGSELTSDYMLVSYRTTFHTYLLRWEPGAEPAAENIGKTRYSRFKIFDLIRETRLYNSGNEYFSEYTATLDLWGTLTRQELD